MCEAVVPANLVVGAGGTFRFHMQTLRSTLPVVMGIIRLHQELMVSVPDPTCSVSTRADHTAVCVCSGLLCYKAVRYMGAVCKGTVEYVELLIVRSML